MRRWIVNGALVVLAAAMLMSAGCGRRRARLLAAQGAQGGAPASRELLATAARDTGCPAAQLATVQINQTPPVYSVNACGTTMDYWGLCNGRRCQWQQVPALAPQAAAVLQCDPGAVSEQPTGTPMMRNAIGCGRMGSFNLACTGVDCTWVQNGPVQAMGGGPTYAAAPPPPTNSAPTVVSGEPSANLQAQVRTQREAILSCVDVSSFNLTLRWTAEGQVILQLPPELGAAAEGCVQAAVGSLTVVAQSPGQVVVPVQ